MGQVRVTPRGPRKDSKTGNVAVTRRGVTKNTTAAPATTILPKLMHYAS